MESIPTPPLAKYVSKLLTDPRLLPPVLHSFCLKCLQEEASNADSDPQQGVTCVTLWSTGNTTSNCYEFLCQSCLDYHKRHRTFKQHEVVTLGEDATTCLMAILKPKQPLCPEPAHEDVLKFYCQTCNKLVCRECTVINHKDHRQVEVASEAEAQRGELRGIVESSTDIEEKLTVAIERGTTMLEFVDTTRQEVTARIDEAFDKLHQALEEKRLSLLATTNDITLYRASQLSTQKQEWEFWYSELNRYVEKSNDILLTHSEEQFVALRKSVQNKLNGIIEKGSDMCFEPNPHSDIPVFIETAILLKEIPQCGFIPMTTLHPKASGCKVAASFKQQLCITMNGLHVHNSPCDVEVKGTRTKRGRKVTRNYNAVKNVQLTIPISFPWQVGIHDNGTIYITDIGTLCVHVLDPLGNKKMVIGSTSTAKAQFNSPRGIALKGEVMYVTRQLRPLRPQDDLERGPAFHFRETWHGGRTAPSPIPLLGTVFVGKGFSSPWDVAIDPWGEPPHRRMEHRRHQGLPPAMACFVRSYGEKVLVNPRGIRHRVAEGYIFVSDGGTGD
eukprot:Em0009g136a